MGPLCYMRFGNQMDMFTPGLPRYAAFINSGTSIATLCLTDTSTPYDDVLSVIDGLELVIAEVSRISSNMPRAVVILVPGIGWYRSSIRRNSQVSKPLGVHGGLAPVPANWAIAVNQARRKVPALTSKETNDPS